MHIIVHIIKRGNISHVVCVCMCVQVLRTVTKDAQAGHTLAVNEFTTFVLGTGVYMCVGRRICSWCWVFSSSCLWYGTRVSLSPSARTCWVKAA